MRISLALNFTLPKTTSNGDTFLSQSPKATATGSPFLCTYRLSLLSASSTPSNGMIIFTISGVSKSTTIYQNIHGTQNGGRQDYSGAFVLDGDRTPNAQTLLTNISLSYNGTFGTSADVDSMDWWCFEVARAKAKGWTPVSQSLYTGGSPYILPGDWSKVVLRLEQPSHGFNIGPGYRADAAMVANKYTGDMYVTLFLPHSLFVLILLMYIQLVARRFPTFNVLLVRSLALSTIHRSLDINGGCMYYTRWHSHQF
jgi:hypothetical protein